MPIDLGEIEWIPLITKGGIASGMGFADGVLEWVDMEMFGTEAQAAWTVMENGQEVSKEGKIKLPPTPFRRLTDYARLGEAGLGAALNVINPGEGVVHDVGVSLFCSGTTLFTKSVVELVQGFVSPLVKEYMGDEVDTGIKSWTRERSAYSTA